MPTFFSGKKLVPFVSSVFFVLLLMVPALASARQEVWRNSLGMEFVLIPAGSFTMGSPRDEPHRDPSEVQHRVTLTKPFYMQTTEVTLSQWRALMGERFFEPRNEEGDLPVLRISWYDCMEFVEKLNRRNEGSYRLPTEAEWEYACRAGSTTAYSWGDTIDCSKALYGNSSDDSGACLDHIKSRGFPEDGPAPVRSYPANAWGLYDMHGNAWEWCQDWYGDYPSTPGVDPTGPPSGTDKIRRGGSWFKEGYACRSANRAYGHPPTRYRTTGFRLVREAD